MARGAPQLLRRALSRGKHHVALPRRALSTTSQKAILITSPQGSAFVRVKNSNQGELFSTSNAAASSLNQEQDELRRSESLERVKSVTHATPNNGLLSRAEAIPKPTPDAPPVTTATAPLYVEHTIGHCVEPKR